MVAEVEIGTAVYSFQFLETGREIELDVSRRIGLVSQLLVFFETVVLCTHTHIYVPLHTGFLPLPEPVEFGARLDEELHFHLLERPHSEYELAGNNFVAEGFSYLCEAWRRLHASCRLDVEIADEDALGCFRTKIDGACALGCASH